MAQNFYRYQAKARGALRPGQKIRYIPGQGYRIVNDPGYSPTGITGRTVTTPYGAFPATPPAPAPINEKDIWEQARTRAGEIANPILQMIAERQAREEERARATAEARASQMEAAWRAAREPIQKIYEQHIGNAQSIENAVANRLQSTGAGQQSEIAAKLAAINAPGAAETASQTGGMYNQAAAAEYAKGMGDVGALVRSSAADQSFVEKQGPLARGQVMSELAQLLGDLSSRYGEEREEITANIPAQIQQLFEGIYGRKSAERDTAAEQSRYGYEQDWRRKEYVDARRRQIQEDAMAKRKELREAQLVAQELGDKDAERRLKQQEKALDRQLRADLAQLQAETTMRGQDISADTAAQNRAAANARAAAARAAAARGEGGGKNETVATPGSAKRGRVANAINNELFIKGQQREWVTHAPTWARVATRINAVMRSHGVNPNSPEGIQLRKAAFTRLGIPTGPKGNPLNVPANRR